MLLVTVLLEAGTEFSWSSGTAISLIILSGLLWILFLVNERTITSEKRPQEPIFPSRFLFNRAWMGTLLYDLYISPSRTCVDNNLRISLLSGIPYNIIVIDLPQRFQAVDGVSPFGAGVRLIPFNFLISFGSVVVNLVALKARIPPIYLLFAGSVFQMTGIAFLSFLPEGKTVPSAIYGYEVLAGFGIGMMFGMCLVIPPHVVEARDLGMF